MTQDFLNMRTPYDVDRSIRAACIAGFVAGVLYAGVGISQVVSLGYAPGGAMLLLFGAMLLFGLVRALLRYSRLAALGLLTLGSALHLLAWYDSQGVVRVGMSVVLLALVFFFARGLQATLMHRRLARRYSAWQQTMDSALDPRLFEEESEPS